MDGKHSCRLSVPRWWRAVKDLWNEYTKTPVSGAAIGSSKHTDRSRKHSLDHEGSDSERDSRGAKRSKSLG